MTRFFNTAGPCNSRMHYMLPPERRLPGVRRLIDAELYFVVHAPRQSGKTTALLALAESLTEGGRYAALLASCEAAQAYPRDPDRAEQLVIEAIHHAAAIRLPLELRPERVQAPAGAALGALLSDWARRCPLPVVLFLDEIDALMDEGLLSVLRQVRSGYSDRPGAFPHTVALIGLRDVRDYRVRLRPDDASLGTSSPFNIKVESVTLRDFTPDEVAELYGQHTAETGQPIASEAVEQAYELTRGQPWLVNALAREITWNMVQDHAVSITAVHVAKAKETLIQRRDTHLDSLTDRLREPRVRAIIEPIVAGRPLGPDVQTDDIEYVEDLGLVRRRGAVEIANPIYKEVIPRALGWVAQRSIPTIEPSWRRADGTLDWDELLRLFLDFWKQHGEAVMQVVPYHEAAAQLVFLAFLQRIVNAKGSVEREYAVGMGRMDVAVRWPHPGGEQRFAVELKVWRPGAADPVNEGKEQLARYLDRLGLETGTLIIFDRRPAAPALPDRVRVERHQDASQRTITVVRA